MRDSNNAVLELAHREHFTVPEWLEREKCISTIRRFDVARLEAAKALVQIRDKNFYRPYGSLKEFCQRTFSWSPHRTDQMIDGAKTLLSLPSHIAPLVQNERQIREIKKHPQDKRPEIVEDAIRFHAKGKKLTTKAISDAAIVKSFEEEDKHGNPIPAAALPYWNRRDEIEDMMSHASALRVSFSKISESDPLYHRLWPVGGMKQELDGIFRALQGILPSYVCGYCEGTNDVENCKGCNGTGLLSVYLDKALPPEKRANARRS